MNALDNVLRLPLASSSPARLPRSARIVLALLNTVQVGSLEVRLPDGSSVHIGRPGHGTAALDIASWTVFERILERGDVGFAEAFIDGDWHSPDLATLLTLLVNNRQHIGAAVYGRWWSLLAARLQHRFNVNTRSGSRRNIMAHYDLGNDFYRLWLDPTMRYSSALYSGDAPCALAGAQLAKYRCILHRLQARPGPRVLGIGCGWGGFAEVAAREGGLEVVGLTLSPAQAEFARRRMDAAGIADQVRIEPCDYRDVGGQRFDHLVSIEMFEVVGERWWPTYFATLKRLLAADGRALVQSITIRDELFARYRRAPTSSSSISSSSMSFPAACCRAAAPSGTGRQQPVWSCMMPSASAATTRARWPSGPPVWSGSGHALPRSVSMSASGSCGASILPVARQASAVSASTSSSSNCGTRHEDDIRVTDIPRQRPAGRAAQQLSRLAPMGQRRNDLVRNRSPSRHLVGAWRPGRQLAGEPVVGAAARLPSPHRTRPPRRYQH